MTRRNEIFYYLEFLKRSRQPRSHGELFCIKFRGKGYIAGRVISTNCAIASEVIQPDAPIERAKEAHLIYIYRQVYATPDFDSPKRIDELLLPPLICLTGWTQGFFLPLRVETPDQYEVLPVHCFSVERYDHRKNQVYFMFADDQGRKLPKCYQPCGRFGPWTHRGVEKLIAKAHGWPLAESDATS